MRKPGSPPYMALEPVLLWPGAAGDTRQRYQQCGLNRDVGDPETQRCPEPGLTRGPFPLGLSRQRLGLGVSLTTLTLLRVSPSPERVTVLPSPGLSVPVIHISTPTHPFIQQKTAKNPKRTGTPVPVSPSFSPLKDLFLLFFLSGLSRFPLPPLYPVLSASLFLHLHCPPSPPPASFASFFLFSLICNEAAQLPEGQCRISPRDQREDHIDKESCHQILQLHIKCTVHGKDGEGAGRAPGWFGEKRGEKRIGNR